MKDFPVATAATGNAPSGVIVSRAAHVLRLGGMALLVAVLVGAVGAGSSSPASPTSGPLIEFWDGTSWTQQVSPNPNGTGSFNAVSATSATDAWAVGSYGGDVETPLAAHWDGSSWQQVAMPTPAAKSDLTGVTAISATDAWAVGWHGKRQFREQRPLIEHWNGSAWKIVPSPSPGRDALLVGVAASSPRNVWAVGTYTARYRYSKYHTLVLHWNGTGWKRIPSPNPGLRDRDGSSLSGVAVVSAKSVWAVGRYSSRSSSRDNSYPTRTLVLHWNGKKWRRVRSTNPGNDRGLSNALNGVAALGRNNVWAVGGTYNNVDQGPPLVEHWNGYSWRTVPAPGLPDCYWQGLGLTTLAPLGRNDVWAAGSGVRLGGCANAGYPAHQALAEHWDGKVWSVSPIVNPPSAVDDPFYGIAAATPRAVWAVGFYCLCERP
jgi:hypothetical protein